MKEKSQGIAYCGLYCDECSSHTGIIADLARDLRKELRAHRFDKTAETLSKFGFFKIFENYDTCYEVLGAMVKMRCKPGCRAGGGNPFCKIRECSKKKGFSGCWECSEYKTCEKLDFLKTNHGVAHIKNMNIISKKGIENFLQGKKHWYVKEKDKK